MTQPLEPRNNGVAIISGGLDSVTMLYHLYKEGHRPHAISFDYGQRHKKELNFARDAAGELNLAWDLIDLTYVGHILALAPESSLTNPDVPVPDGHYAQETMKQTIVPNRNMMMLAIATSICVAEKGEFVAAAMHAGDHYIYPRP